MYKAPFRKRIRLAKDSAASSQLAADALVQKFRLLPMKAIVPKYYEETLTKLLKTPYSSARSYTSFCKLFPDPPKTLSGVNALILLESLITAHVHRAGSDDPVRRCLCMTYRQYSESVGFPDCLPKKSLDMPMATVLYELYGKILEVIDYFEKIRCMIGCAEHIAELSNRDGPDRTDEIIEYIDLAMERTDDLHLYRCGEEIGILLPDMDYGDLRNKGRLMPTDPMRERYFELILLNPEKYLKQVFETVKQIHDIFVRPFQ